MSMGVLLATNAINVAHELGHRKGLFERTLSKLIYMPCLYMHFYIEHNFGHHLNVATDKDGASARYNQNLYFFWIRSVTKQYIDAWKKQRELLEKSSSSFFSFKNDMLCYTIIQPLYLIVIYYTFTTPCYINYSKKPGFRRTLRCWRGQSAFTLFQLTKVPSNLAFP